MVIAKLIFSTMRKLIVLLLLTIPSLALAIDLEGYYITAKGGVSKTLSAGVTHDRSHTGAYAVQKNEDLGKDSAFGLSAGKYLSDNFRLELEATKRTGYEYDVGYFTSPQLNLKANIETHALFINGFYDFQPFSINNTPITHYLGGGLGFSRNKMGTSHQTRFGQRSGASIEGHTMNQFAYKLSAGTLVSLIEQVSLDVNYQYINLGAFKGGSTLTINGVVYPNFTRGKGINGGVIKSHELMVGLQYKF